MVAKLCSQGDTAHSTRTCNQYSINTNNLSQRKKSFTVSQTKGECFQLFSCYAPGRSNLEASALLLMEAERTEMYFLVAVNADKSSGRHIDPEMRVAYDRSLHQRKAQNTTRISRGGHRHHTRGAAQSIKDNAHWRQFQHFLFQRLTTGICRIQQSSLPLH